MADELLLYTHPMSRGRIARWMLEEVGQPYRVDILDYGGRMKAPEFLAINPMGKVPTLVHGRTVVTEGAAICAYLGAAFPDAGLAPPVGSPAAGDYYRWLFFAAGPLEAAITDRSLGVTVPDGRERMVGYGTFGAALDALEYAVAGKSFIAGDRFSAADLYVGAQIGFGLQFGTIPTRPAFADYWAGLAERPAYKRAAELDDAAMPKPPA